ncbi:hypothetical protein F5883DRAFT_674530 [Diaporthe sp. PMI_573]|nr:hypothetical protein F5883DRAFT_674530 [Diaporthaceae sp. PMI_573]
MSRMGGIIDKKEVSAGVETHHGWKTYLSTEEQESVLLEARLIEQGHQPGCHRRREGSALFWASSSGYGVRCKLAELLAALESGADPNAEQSEVVLHLRSGRPLDLCLDDSKADLAGESLLNNIPVIQMLLDYGADPRLDPLPPLKGVPACPLEPVEEARRSAQWGEGSMKAYFSDAYRLMRRAADALDRLESSPGSEKVTRDTDDPPGKNCSSEGPTQA